MAVKLRSNYHEAYFNRGIICAKTGNRLKAIADRQKVRDILLEIGDISNYKNVEQLSQKHQQPLSSIKV